MAEIESMVEPDSVADDIWRESVALINIHGPILPLWGSYLGSTVLSYVRARVAFTTFSIVVSSKTPSSDQDEPHHRS